VAEDIRFAHAALDWFVRGTACSLYISVSRHLFKFLYRFTFGVWRLAFTSYSSSSSSSSSIWVAVPFHAIARLQRLEGSRFTPLQVLAVRPEETNPELPDGVASRRLPGTSPTLGSTHPPEQRDNLEDEDDDEYEDDY
jgi:hypothetical protein